MRNCPLFSKWFWVIDDRPAAGGQEDEDGKEDGQGNGDSYGQEDFGNGCLVDDPFDSPDGEGSDGKSDGEFQSVAGATPSIGGKTRHQAVFDGLHTQTEEEEKGGNAEEERSGGGGHPNYEGKTGGVEEQVDDAQVVTIGQTSTN